jgi:hypothetical protein
MRTGDHPRAHKPGFLLSPLGWLNEPLRKELLVEPDLLRILFELEPYQMHLLGLALAHTGSGPTSASRLINEPPKLVIEQTVGFWPVGLDRLLHSLPPGALGSDSYRAIPALLSDRKTAIFLHHRKAVDERLILALAALPACLRRPGVFKLLDQLEPMDSFVRGLRFLSIRVGLPFEDLASQIGKLRQTDQIIARVAQLIDELPIPKCLPAACIGPFRRVDGVAEIRKLAKTWRNCLTDLLYAVNDGTAAIYLTKSTPHAIALVLRADRLGWFVDQIKGPKNASLGMAAEGCYQQAFSRAGIPEALDLAVLRDLVLQTRWERRRAG